MGASGFGHLDVVKELINNQADVNAIAEVISYISSYYYYIY